MSRLKTLAIAAAAALLSSQASLAVAAGSGTLSASATVIGTCKITSVPTMAFGSIDPSSTSNATATSTVLYKCTKNTAPTSVTVGASGSPYAGTLASTATPADTMSFSVTWTNPTAAGNGFGAADQSFDLTGTITVANFQNAPAHTDYAASATVSINP